MAGVARMFVRLAFMSCPPGLRQLCNLPRPMAGQVTAGRAEMKKFASTKFSNDRFVAQEILMRNIARKNRDQTH